jgi:long-subunit acyl-CoA synthetase (AMP-forming)
MSKYTNRDSFVGKTDVSERFILGIKKPENGILDESNPKYIVTSEDVTKTGLDELKKEHPEYFIRPVKLPEDEIPTQELLEKILLKAEEAARQTSNSMKLNKEKNEKENIKQENEKLIKKSKNKLNV